MTDMAPPNRPEGHDAALTHGRHCSCSACAREDWTKITAPCGMHGEGCPPVYAPDAATACEKCGRQPTVSLRQLAAWVKEGDPDA